MLAMENLSDWLPYAMLLVLGVGIVLDSLWIARRDRKLLERQQNGQSGGRG